MDRHARDALCSSMQPVWTDTANNETGFRIERCTGLGCTNFVIVATDWRKREQLQRFSL